VLVKAKFHVDVAGYKWGLEVFVRASKKYKPNPI